MQVDHHSLFYLFVFFYLCYVPPFHLSLSDFFLFSSCLMFDLGSTSTLYSCLFDVPISLSSLFVWGPLGLGLMTFSMHCISCMRGMGIISLGYLSLVSFRFFHPITLAYVTSCVLRPPWGHDFTYCAWQLIHGQYLRLVGDYLSGHSRDGEHFSFEHSHPIGFFTLGHTPLISDGFLEVIWSILGHTQCIDDSFLVGWPYTGA